MKSSCTNEHKASVLDSVQAPLVLCKKKKRLSRPMEVSLRTFWKYYLQLLIFNEKNDYLHETMLQICMPKNEMNKNDKYTTKKHT